MRGMKQKSSMTSFLVACSSNLAGWKGKRWIALLILTSLSVLFMPVQASADAIVGTTVVTLGENLTTEQQDAVLRDMGFTRESDIEIVYVSNKEEHQYLGQYISASRIGTRSISSASITLTPSGSGIHVKTNNIDWVTEEMFTNALATAGVTDAEVYVTAPFAVSGTAGLTGIFKAFEAAADIQLSEEQKQIANEEIVRTAELGDKIGAAQAAELMHQLKEALGNTKLETDEDYRNLILRVANDLNVTLSEEDIASLTHLLKRIKGLNIDWTNVGKQIQHIRDNLDDILNSEETRNFLRLFLDFLVGLIERLKTLFSA